MFTFLISILAWFSLPSGTIEGKHNFKYDLAGVLIMLKNPVIWIHSIILLCAYVGYKLTDDFSLYAQDVLGLDEVKSAGVGALGIWLRPVAAITAGLLADRYLSSRLIIYSFILLMIGGIATSSGFFENIVLLPYVFLFLFVGCGAYALRVLYYSVMEEAGIPLVLTGTAVGIISVVGYTPDVFIGPLMGWLLDASPGVTGHRHVFLVLTGFACIGFVASIWYRILINKGAKSIAG